MDGVLSRRVLMLNRNYEPMSVVSARKAIILLYLGKAEVVERYDLWVHSVSTRMPVPSIVRLVSYVRIPHRRVVLTRKNIIKRDNRQCQYCGTRTGPFTVDHVIPKDRGGTDSWENLVCACVRCNSRKGNRTPEEAGMRLLRKPKKPNHLFFIQHLIGVYDERWKPYLFMN
ncbi:MAG TPA: HNH endonuclease [Bacteroidetes bacterium]|nr:HNH endonuclease [Bacteroidota bacterium]